jgi:pimeloyl-ACP methyl ester carboxylesterase
MMRSMRGLRGLPGLRRAAIIGVAVLVAGLWTPSAQATTRPTLQPTAQATTAQPASGPTLRIGSVTLHRCNLHATKQAWCGSITVPLDYTDPSAARISIGFGWFPSRTAPVPDAIVAQEGGPGYPSTGTAPDYVDMLGSLLNRHNLLVVDARGTGRSTPLDCEPLQSLPAPSPAKVFTAAVTACGRQLNHTFAKAGGGYVHASDLFTTANSARDMARVLKALRVGPVDLYGDSYGTYFAQSFLARFPTMLRSVVMDSAYEARDLDPWYTTTVTTARRAFDAVCRRAVHCPPGSAWARIGRLAASLRQHPITGRAVGTDASRHTYTVDVTALVNIVNDAGYDFDPYRQLDAAARAYLQHGDTAPLLRLYAQDIGYDYSDYVATPASYYSDGLYLAVACTDYPQLFNMHSSVSGRRQELAASVAALPASTFAPFTTREWIGVLPYTETYTGCLTWPKPTHPADPAVPNGVSMDATHVPVLILNGSIDSLTPAAGGAHIQRQIGSASQAVVVANEVHLVALDSPYECGPLLIRHFIVRPGAHLNTACAAHVPALRAVPNYPQTLSAVRVAIGEGSTRTRRLAAVAVAEAGDALIRYNYVDGDRDLGLRGGTVRYDAAGDATLHAVRYTRDTTTSGTVRVTAHGGAGRITVTGPGGAAETFRVSWGAGRWANARQGRTNLLAPSPGSI